MGRLLYFISGYLIGYFAFGDPCPQRLILAALIPYLWCAANDRYRAALLIFGYNLAAGRGIPVGSAVFFMTEKSHVLGAVLLLSSTIILTLPWILFFNREKSFSNISLRLFIIFIIISVPPIGFIGWASPLLAAGFLFPGLGWFGLLSFIFVSAALPCLSFSSSHKKIFMTVTVITIILLSFFVSPRILPPKDFIAVNTSFGHEASGSAHDVNIETILKIVKKAKDIDAQYILLPETIMGRWTDKKAAEIAPHIRDLQRQGKTLIAGTEIFNTQNRYDNVLLFLGYDSGKKYKQRIPVPFSMWRPWAQADDDKYESANAYITESGRIMLKTGKSILCLICYEQYLAWPVLRSMFGYPRPDILLCAANQWWSRDTCIPLIQVQSAVSWAALFNLNLIMATNS